jgi:hypothetical protein
MKKRSYAVMFVLGSWFASAPATELNLDWLAGAWCRSSGEVSSEENLSEQGCTANKSSI